MAQEVGQNEGMLIKDRIPTSGLPPPFPNTLKGLVADFSASNAGHDIWGRLYILNAAYPVTWWRKLCARLGFHEPDTLKSGLTHKPRLVGNVIDFDGSNTMSCYPTIYAVGVGGPVIWRLWRFKSWGDVEPRIEFKHLIGPFYWKT